MLNFLSSVGQKITGFLNERVDYGVRSDLPSRKLINKYFERFPLSLLLPYQSYDCAKQLFFNDGSVGFVLETSPLVGCSDAMQREISGLFQHTLPEGSSIQFLLWADPRIGSFLKNWQKARQQTTEIFQTLAQKRVSFLASQVFGSEYQHQAPLRNFWCIVAYSQAGVSLSPVEEQKLLQLKKQVITALKTLGMPVFCWDTEDLLNMLDGIINFNTQTDPASLKWNPYQSLNQQIPASGMSYQLNKFGISINEGENLIRTYGVHIPFQENIKTRVQSRESWVENQARSKIGKRIPILLKQARELDFVRHQQSKGERFVQTSFIVTLFC